MSQHDKLKRAAELVNKTYADLCEHGGDQLAEAWNTAELAYDDAANPDVVLALIAENERLLKLLERTVEQYVPLTELEGVPGWSRVVKLDEVCAERDQLRAENAGLRTGYQAYERVNAELKAEVEKLRKDAELHAQIQRAAGELPIGWEIRVCVEHESGYVELWDQDGCEVDFPNSCESLGLTVSDAIDAALGQGEQS